MRTILKSKLCNLKVTDANLHYDGSISLDPELMRKADIIEYEQVHVLNATNGKRFITYAIAGDENEVCVNGAASHLVEIDDEIIVLSYSILDGSPVYGSFPPPKIVKCG